MHLQVTVLLALPGLPATSWASHAKWCLDPPLAKTADSMQSKAEEMEMEKFPNANFKMLH